MKNEKPKGMIFYHDWAGALEMLSMRERGELITAIFAHETGRIAPPLKLSSKVQVFLPIIISALERNRETYAESCARNAANGRLGGRPRKKKDEGEP